MSFPAPSQEILKKLGKEKLLELLSQMLLIRHFETRGEAAYQQGFIGGFYHAYSGQEAIQTAAISAFGKNNWYIGFYRCHALALLLGATPNEMMAEMYGRKNGNALGRGGSMHLYTENLLGGFGIVGGHLPIAIGAGFSIKYQNTFKLSGKLSGENPKEPSKELAICFLGEGAVAQGAYHESLNLAALWKLPCIFIIENNHWGMGTHASRAIAVEKIAESTSKSYNISSYTLDGMDIFNCYAGFEKARKEVLDTGKPVIIECVCERFKGHSISDPGLYRTKESLTELLKKDPILYLKAVLEKEKMLTEEDFKRIDKEQKEQVITAMKYAEESPWPSLATLEEDVYAG